jgi:hypothetical protein
MKETTRRRKMVTSSLNENPRISWEIWLWRGGRCDFVPTPFYSKLLDRFLKRTVRFFFRLGYLLHVIYIAEAMRISRTVIIE